MNDVLDFASIGLNGNLSERQVRISAGLEDIGESLPRVVSYRTN